MNERTHSGSGGQTGASHGMNLTDVYHVLFRHKWKICWVSLAGMAAAIFVYFVRPPLYISAAKLYVRYVEDAKLPNGPGNNQVIMPDSRGENIINSEVEILTSLDIANEVVAVIGAKKILAKVDGGSDPDRAALIIKKNIIVEVPKHSDILNISFQHPDRGVVQPVLTQLIAGYLKKHAEIHRDLGGTDNFLTQQTDVLQSQLSKTERELKQAKAKAGVVTLEGAKTDNAMRIAKIRDDILSAEANLAEHQATLKGFSRLVPIGPQLTNSPLVALKRYQGILLRLDVLSRKEQEFMTQFTEDSTPIRGVRQQMSETETLKKQLDQKYPDLAKLVISQPSPTAGSSIDLSAEAIQAQALTSKLDFLNSQLVRTKAEQAQVDDMEATIVDLQRKKELEETKYRYFSSSLEQARFDEALAEGKLSNISVAQSPSSPFRDLSKFSKLLAFIVAGGVLGGIALAFLIELTLDKTLKRPDEVETRLRLPLFLTIPDASRNGYRLPVANGDGHLGLNGTEGQIGAEKYGSNGGGEVMRGGTGHSLRPFFEALRDRLIAHFDANELTHHPKLVAVTCCGNGAGATTIAAGLATALSEAGEGNVLLVDMTSREGGAQPFRSGNPACTLTQVLAEKQRDVTRIQDNLFVVTDGINGDSPAGLIPRQFAGLMPKLKASDYDYIIFDMPPVSQISVTAKLGRFMDINLMVVESEKTEVEIIKQASELVSGPRSNVGLILNKKRTYIPQWLHQEL